MRGRFQSRLAALALLLLLGCGACQRPPSESTGVVFVLIDALRADRLGVYGNPRNTSPNLDRLAQDSAVFLQAIAPAPWTLPSMSTIWTSLHPSVHGAVRLSDLFAKDIRPVAKLDDSRVTFAEVLREHGYRTAAFVDGTYPRKVFGLAQGFEVFVDAELPGIRLNVEAMFDWLDRERPEKFFAYVHTLEVHSPYSPVKLYPSHPDARDGTGRRIAEVLAGERARYAEFDFNPGYEGKINGYWTLDQKPRRNLDPLPERDLEQLFALYDRGVAYTDYWMGVLVEGLKKRGLLDRTLLVVTADHGDELMDHGGVEHGETFYDEMIRVPLLLRVPGLAKGRKFEQQVGLVDLLPTLLDLLRIPHDLPVQGRSFAPLLRDEPFSEEPVFVEAMAARPGAAVRTREWKYIESRDGRELYHLASDPGERVNVCERRAKRCAWFAERLRAWQRANQEAAKQLALPAASAAEVDPETRERLRALGYGE